MDNNNILISAIVCCRNENNYIDRCLDSLLEQINIPGKFEILVVDGMSEDGTREKIKAKMKLHKEIRFFDNSAKVKPQAINTGFRESRGEYFVICDAHAYYDENYISVCLDLINNHPDAWCVGGPFINLGETAFGKANAVAMNSKLGVGNAKHRHPDYEGYGEMVMFGLFPKKVLDIVGYYDENFIINHDDEYCYRLRKAGGRVYISSRAKCYYFVRKTPGSLFRQYFSYGFWQIAFLKKHRVPISYRQLVPFAFFSLVIFMIILSLFLKNFLVGILLPLIYILVLIISAVPVLLKYNAVAALNYPLAIFILHFSYAAGFLSGIIKFAGNKSFSRK